MNVAYKEIFTYVFATLLLLTGFLLIKEGSRKVTPEDKLNKKGFPTSGRGTRFHYIYVGIVCILIGLWFLFQVARSFH